MILQSVWVVGSDREVSRVVCDSEACRLSHFMFLVGVSQVANIITTLVFQRLGIRYMCVRGGGGYCGHF
jgi:hypothetical protein